MAHTKSGTRPQVMPGERIVWTVTMKLSPVMMLEKPRTNTPSRTGMTVVVVVVEYGA